MYAPGAGKEKCRPNQGRLSPERLLFKAEALLIERFSLRSGHRGVSLPGCRTRCFHRITPDAMEFVQQFTIHFNSTEVPLRLAANSRCCGSRGRQHLSLTPLRMDQPRAALWSPVALRQKLPGALLGLPSGESSFTYGLFPPDVPLFAAVFTTTRRATRIIVFTSQSRLPFQVSRARSQTVRPVSSQLRSPRNATSTVLSSVPLFQPLSLSSTASANKPAPGGAAVFCFARAPYGVLVPPTSRAPSKKADLGTWELSHTRALRVVCLERLRASKEIFRCTTTP
jgi:hypothetical protein